jgi:hypothetical protein
MRSVATAATWIVARARTPGPHWPSRRRACTRVGRARLSARHAPWPWGGRPRAWRRPERSRVARHRASAVSVGRPGPGGTGAALPKHPVTSPSTRGSTGRQSSPGRSRATGVLPPAGHPSATASRWRGMGPTSVTSRRPSACWPVASGIPRHAVTRVFCTAHPAPGVQRTSRPPSRRRAGGIARGPDATGRAPLPGGSWRHPRVPAGPQGQRGSRRAAPAEHRTADQPAQPPSPPRALSRTARAPCQGSSCPAGHGNSQYLAYDPSRR